MTQLIEEKIT